MTSLALAGLMFAAMPERVPAAPLSAAEAAHRDALTRFGVGVLRARNTLPVQAVAQFEAAARADATSPGPLRPLVALYTDLGRHAAAIRTARKVLELDPDDAETGQQLGQLLYEGKKFADAAEVLAKAAASPRLADKPARRIGVLRDLARAAEKANDLASAADTLWKASTLLAEKREALVRYGRFATSTEAYRESADVLEDRGRVLARQLKFAEATVAYQEAHRICADPAQANDPAAAARLDWNLSGVLSGQGKVDEALAHLTRFLALKPSGREPYERFADLTRRLGSDRVVADLVRLAEANTTNESIRWLVAAESLRTDRATGVRQFRALAEQTTHDAFYAVMVRSLVDAGALTQLLSIADTLFEATQRPESGAEPPPGFEAAVDRCRALTAAMKVPSNLTASLLAQATADARVGRGHAKGTWELLATLAERDGQLSAAEEMFRRAAGSRGRESAALLLDVLVKQHKWQQVQGEATRAIAAAGQGSRSLQPDWVLAVAHAELGEGPQALAALRPFEALGTASAATRKPSILNILGRHADAVDECRKLLEQFPKPADQRLIRYVLSASYLGLGRHAEAEAELRAILDDDPDDAQALNNLGYNLADQGRKLAEAETLVRRAVEVDADRRLRDGDAEPDNGTYLDSLGWVLFRRGKLAEAREVLERAVRTPDAASSGEVWDHIGDVRFRAGDRNAAREAWTKAAAMYEHSHEGRQNGRHVEVLRKLGQAE